MYTEFMTWLIVIFGTINVIRIGFFMIGSDIYSVIEAYKRKNYESHPKKTPSISIVIPAHNEESTIINSVISVVCNNYPKNKVQIVVVDDGSTDRTVELLKKYAEQNPKINLLILSQKNAGKAHALNNAMSNHATGELVMCLDADSTLDPNALREAAYYFSDDQVMAMAANVKIRPDSTLLNLIQQYEYIICYQMKRALTVFNIEYIVGGIGSVFRRTALEKVGFYDTDTITEDIDLTMKILQNGGKNWKVIYGASVVAYTEGVLSLSGLIKQRYRWKFGRSQAFYKNRNLFFNTDKKHNRLLTWVNLPFAIYSDLAFFFEPLIISYIFYIIFRYTDWVTFISAVVVVGGYITMNVVMEPTIPWRRRLKLAILAPSMYVFFYVLSFVEYVALIRGMLNILKIKHSIKNGGCGWQHVERPKLQS